MFVIFVLNEIVFYYVENTLYKNIRVYSNTPTNFSSLKIKEFHVVEFLFFVITFGFNTKSICLCHGSKLIHKSSISFVYTCNTSSCMFRWIFQKFFLVVPNSFYCDTQKLISA